MKSELVYFKFKIFFDQDTWVFTIVYHLTIVMQSRCKLTIVLSVKDCFLQNLCFWMGNGQNISFWYDKWLPSEALVAQILTDPPALCAQVRLIILFLLGNGILGSFINGFLYIWYLVFFNVLSLRIPHTMMNWLGIMGHILLFPSLEQMRP